jgi:hypothetical protein
MLAKPQRLSRQTRALLEDPENQDHLRLVLVLVDALALDPAQPLTLAALGRPAP